MTECKNKKINLENCNCTYEPCERKGICCECILYHRRQGQLPACYFSPVAEKTYDRSIKKFISDSK
ncbi:MAG: DUF6485 family protein [Candidatus Omnitrophica bacterium]|nr:DUF6485 family protein [Candidatus Omnitrophota bacterium]HOX53998.1 DUF6485 family protein [Candidatus Omnitrophota bacterium]